MTKYVVLPVEPTEEIQDAINTHLNEYGHHEDCTMLWEAIKEAAPKPDVVVVERGRLVIWDHECRFGDEEDVANEIKQLLEGAG